MTLYKVTIEDRVYEVKVEEIETKGAVKTEAVTKETPKTSATQTETVDGTPVPAPLAGTVLSVKVKVGDKVSAGDVLLSLEALKLENEIVSPVAGTVAQIVSTGESVVANQVIAIIN